MCDSWLVRLEKEAGWRDKALIGLMGAGTLLPSCKDGTCPKEPTPAIYHHKAPPPRTTEPVFDEPERSETQPESKPVEQKIEEKVKPVDSHAPRGVRNNNPGNIESGQKWQGAIQSKDSRFLQFETPEYGFRAMARVLRSYQRQYKLNTIRELIGRWAPPHENDTKKYIDFVARKSGLSATQPINLEDDTTLSKVIKAIAQFENGGNYYNDNQILKGIQMEKH